MSEIFPSDAYLENLSGVTELNTGVYYPAKGEGLDWYVSFVKCIYRLVKNVSVVIGLRVYKTASLSCGVKSGTFFDGNTLREYAGTEEQSLTDNTTNYIYMTAGGMLQVNTTGFPDPAVTRHIRLGTVQTADGGYDDDDIADYRMGQIWNVAGPVGASQLSDTVADLVSKIQITVGVENANTIAATLRVLDCQDNGNANRFLIHAWLADSQYGAETATAPGGTVNFTTGTQLAEITSKKRWQTVTDSAGQAVLSIGESGARTWYLNVELDGRIYAGPAISFT